MNPLRSLGFAGCAAALALAACGGGGGSTTPPPPPAVVVAVTVAPADVSLAKGLHTQLSATARLDDGNSTDVTARASWSSSNPDVATVSGGAVIARAEGGAVITVSVDAVTATVPVAVGPAIAVALRLEPATLAIPAGLSQRLSAAAVVLTDGAERPVTGPVTWSSADAAIAGVAADGTVAARAQGSTHVQAAADGVQGSATVEVGPPVLSALHLAPLQRTGVVRGTTPEYAATGTFSDGSERDVTAEVTWTTIDAAVATVVSPGRLRALAGGSTRVRAEQGGISAEATLGVLGTRLVFTTSTTGSSDFRSRADTGRTGGSAGADIACSSAARAAGLPGTYRAWISDSHDDAWCRVHGVGGKKIDNCGQPALPGDAGPWVRTDGTPFADSLTDALAGALHPPMLDEYGHRVRTGQVLWTGTGQDGAADRSPYTPPTDYCQDWTGGAQPDLPPSDGRSSVAYGEADRAGHTWASIGWVNCGAPGALLCMEVGAGRGEAWPARTPTPGKRIFVTSTMGTGNLGAWGSASGATGRAAGDAICAWHAAAAGLGGTFKAWLSTSSSAASSRLNGDGPWVRLDGELIAANRAELTSGVLRTAVLQTETGALHEYGVYAWTGTTPFGAATPQTCQSWTVDWANPVVYGETGHVESAGVEWTTQAFTQACTNLAALYCIED